MSVKGYYCDQCGSPINFAGKTNVICQTCGLNNVNTVAEKANIDARALAEQFLGDLEDLKESLQSQGDAQARDFNFRKFFLPRLEVVFEDLIENYDDYFRRPLFQIKMLKRYSKLFNVKKVFKTEKKKGYSKEFVHDLNQFAMGQLELDVMNLMATGEKSQLFIQTCKHHTMFLSRLYNIRGIALRTSIQSMAAVQNLLELANEDCTFLAESYKNLKYGMVNAIKFEAWKLRITLNLNIAKLMTACLNGQYDDIFNYFDQLIGQIDSVIDDYRVRNQENEELYPLFLIMVIIEGFSIDKKIVEFLKKIVDTIIRGNITKNILEVLAQIEDLIDIADTAFNDVKISSAEWDSHWIENLEEPFERLFQLLDNLVLNRHISSGQESVYLLNFEPEVFNPWLSDDIVDGKSLNKTYFNLKRTYNVKNRIQIYLPIAILNTYAILKTGLIRKGGDEFESILLINPYFRFDPTINNYGYAKAFGYIDIAETLKEKDIMKGQLALIDEKVESEAKSPIKINAYILPILVTQKEIEEFVQKAYDLFEFVQETSPPIPKFNQLYSNVGIAKKVEKLSGELLDFLYVPALLLEMAEGVIKKDEFVMKSDYEWKILLPYNNEPKDPFNTFLKMEINPINILNIALEIQKLHQ